ncbi:MAG: biopolymer transporter ExbD [Bacteroidota bacterium]
MPKIKPKRLGVAIDMTPMVDVAFLLLTFFMLASNFRPAEEVQIALPSSTSDIKLPESDVLTINVAKDGRLFVGTDRVPLMVKLFGEKAKFKASWPVPKERLASTLVSARISNPKIRTVIKGDAETSYGNVQDVMDVLQKINITRFNLVTELKRQAK